MKLLKHESLRSLIVSTFTLILDTAILDLLKVVLGIDYLIFNIFYLSKLISSIVGAIVSFYLQRTWAFKSQNSLRSTASKFVVTYFINLVTLNFFFTFYYTIFSNAIENEAFSATAGSIAAGITQWILSFCLYKFFVFRK
jgi:putative flippase GtrA